MPALEAIALSTPVIAAQTIFAARKTRSGVNVLDENPVEGALTMGIAGAQTLKVVAASKALCDTKNIANVGSKDLIQKSTTVLDACKGTIGKGLKYIANNVNGFIYAAGVAKVLGAKDKEDTAIDQACAIGTMRAGEELYKYATGMPKTEITSAFAQAGETVRPCKFVEDGMKAISDTKLVKSVIEKLPENVTNFMKNSKGALKGLGFAIASILSYQAGHKLALCIINAKNGNNNFEKEEEKRS